MRILLFVICFGATIVQAQSGFNKSYDFGYYINYFQHVIVGHDTIVALGRAQDTAALHQNGVIVARFDSLGNHLDHILLLEHVWKFRESKKIGISA